MRLEAPAKINLQLRVGRRRDDGFHPLVSWMCTVGLFDTLELEPRIEPGFALECDRPELPCDASNLVARAAELLSAEAQARRTSHGGARGRLQKRIPIGAGLGGGSSDGARALLGLNALWQLHLDRPTLAGLAARLGSDVPFFLYEPSAACAGRGEVVRPLRPPAARWAVLILPALLLSTRDVYARFDDLALGSSEALAAEPPWEQWSGQEAGVLLPRLVNDLERPAFSLAPELGRLRDSAQAALSRVVRMSGSGSALFSLYDQESQAQAAAQKLRQALRVRCEAAGLAPVVRDDLNAVAQAR